MKYQILLNKIELFNKIANDQIESLLHMALSQNNREAFLVFLDLLEERHPKARELLMGYPKSDNPTLWILHEYFPNVIKVTQGEVSGIDYFSFDNWSDFTGISLMELSGLKVKYPGAELVTYNSDNGIGILRFDRPMNGWSRIEVHPGGDMVGFELPSGHAGRVLLPPEYDEMQELYQNIFNKAIKDTKTLKELIKIPGKKY